ncbi:hypothetical protein K493DRAFT_317098 [Basidiobolus meristosporus CBS 931.73]|uniref:Splicing factor Cactin n=1 Tax=Basidiobolus meristosporus CBS 931.73 TaxID=1314790 RepID=A0A1Y1Y1G6_9FUNG|nr:hypothetical protein K493DRAFT_317098 [Basidiobolus meristosporus CBS 931.73]|eukprot:ORX91735.1 hypothetical protein K493DRAFT_317098 [Basidiobolus meristosporus CBS 931.73]
MPRRSVSPERSRHSRRRDRDDSRDGHRRSRRSPSRSRSRSRSPRRRHRSRSASNDRDRGSPSRKSSRKHRSPSDSDEHSRKSKRSKEKKKSKRRETSEERKLRKEQRRREKRSEILAIAENFGYTEVDNPFGDSNLGQKFVWRKKKEKDSKLGLSESEIARRERERREEAKIELEKLNKRRTEREIEMQLREEEKARLQREADLAALGDWQSKEDEFHLEQAKLRAEIRIKENRAKPIDILAINIRLADEGDKAEDLGLEISMDEPYAIFENLEYDDVVELKNDLQLYLTLEKKPKNIEFWESMSVVCEDKLSTLRAQASNPSGIVDAVADDITNLLSNKTYEQLTILEEQIHRKLASNEPIDTEYWEQLLKALVVWKAKVKLRNMHTVIIQKRLEQLRNKQREDALKVQHELQETLQQEIAKGDEADEPMTTEVEQGIPYNRAMSPILCSEIPREDRDLPVLDPEEELQKLLQARQNVQKNHFFPRKLEIIRKPVEAIQTDLDSEISRILYEKEAAQDLDEDEDFFNIEASLAKTTYLWEDKYRPRKPRFFNRVHTGYEWNKYNQTHYDVDNPPPKVVQGYKFNIFYPDLIDKSQAPTYKIEPDPEAVNGETVFIRFVAGPPYEDIAFRIVNREWEYSHKKGFRSSFDRGVLQLHFHFRRHFYRR